MSDMALLKGMGKYPTKTSFAAMSDYTKMQEESLNCESCGLDIKKDARRVLGLAAFRIE
jgi:PHP family Zn ribbon phosphoesterase